MGVSTEEGVMENAAERMLGLDLNQIRLLGQDIIFGQMRVAHKCPAWITTRHSVLPYAQVPCVYCARHQQTGDFI